jgi:hypothetical protein
MIARYSLQCENTPTFAGSVAARIALQGEYMVLDIGRAPTKAEGHTILPFDQLLHEFNARDHNSGIRKRVKPSMAEVQNLI